jgi:hypothetical protein
MFNFPGYKRDVNQNYSDFMSPQLEWPYSRVKTTNAGESAAK